MGLLEVRADFPSCSGRSPPQSSKGNASRTTTEQPLGVMPQIFGSVASLSAVASLLDSLLCTRPAFAFSPSSPYQTRRSLGNCSQARSVTSGTLRLSGRRSAGIAHGTGRVLLPQLVHLSGEAQVTGWGGEWCFNVLLGHPHAILNEYH